MQYRSKKADKYEWHRLNYPLCSLWVSFQKIENRTKRHLAQELSLIFERETAKFILKSQWLWFSPSKGTRVLLEMNPSTIYSFAEEWTFQLTFCYHHSIKDTYSCYAHWHNALVMWSHAQGPGLNSLQTTKNLQIREVVKNTNSLFVFWFKFWPLLFTTRWPLMGRLQYASIQFSNRLTIITFAFCITYSE